MAVPQGTDLLPYTFVLKIQTTQGAASGVLHSHLPTQAQELLSVPARFYTLVNKILAISVSFNNFLEIYHLPPKAYFL